MRGNFIALKNLFSLFFQWEVVYGPAISLVSYKLDAPLQSNSHGY